MSVDSLNLDSKPETSFGIGKEALLYLEEHAKPSGESIESEGGKDGEEQALETHEVVELQAFSERKDWIRERIKVHTYCFFQNRTLSLVLQFLEAMPQIELFAGLDAVRSSTQVVHGLPLREELKKWLIEHDKLEKETEVFDSGELKKFKMFTKGACTVCSPSRLVEVRTSCQRPPSATCPLRIQISLS
jgi:hypothetical protein